MQTRIDIVIAGRGLRNDAFSWIESLASSMLIRGTAFARADGSIIISAEGDENALRLFAEKVRKGWIFIGIENFFIKWHEPSKSNFHVLAGV